MFIVHKIAIPFITVSIELVTYASWFKIKLFSVTQHTVFANKQISKCFFPIDGQSM